MSRPTSRTLRRAAVAGGVLAGLAVPSAAFAADPASTAVVLTTDNKISTFETAYPSEATAPVPVTGLATDERLVGIDVRPQNGFLYGVAFKFDAVTPANSTLQVYAISTRTATAKAVGLPQAVAGTTNTTNFGVDFNPSADRLRVTSDSGLNLRINPNTGAFVTDTALSPAADSKIDGAAYTSNKQNPTVTTLYTLSGDTNKLYRQGVGGSPNGGVQTAVGTLKSSGADVDFSAVGGFDIAPGVDAPSTNGEVEAPGAGYATLKVPGGPTVLAKIELKTGNATAVGLIGNGATDVAGLAIQQETVAGGLPAVSLSDGKIVRFDSTAPTATENAANSATITGLTPLETPVAIDWRPKTGQLLLLGVNATANTGTLYVLDPQLGTPTAIGTPGSIKFTTDGITPVDLPASGYDIDVNPAVDLVRVVTSSGLNFRVNPDTGAVSDGNNGAVAAVTGDNPDGSLKGDATIGTDVGGTAYTNAFGQTTPTTPAGLTTQYGLSASKDTLQIQNPPNSGTQTLPLPLKIGGATLDVATGGVRGFDIPASVTSAAPNAAATAGSGLAALESGGSLGLYSIDLATGTAALKGPLAGTTTSVAIGDGPPATKVRNPPVILPPVIIPPVVQPPVVQPPVVTPPKKAGFGSSTKLTVKLRATKISRNGPAKVTFRNTNKFAVKVRLQATTPKSGKRKAIKYATKTYTVKASSSRTVNLRLPSAARKVLTSKRKLTIKVTLRVTAPDGKSRTVRKTLTARRK